MDLSHITSAEETSSIAKPHENGSGSSEGSGLIDELGPIPTFPPAAVDPDTGQILAVSEADVVARRDAVLRMLKVLDEIADESDTDEDWREVYRSIDAGRPHRPLFTGLY
jgi:hypothetical protein